MSTENPVLPGFHPDPTVCRADETFYLATSSFEYFPGVPLYRSSNLVGWEPIGHALTRESQLETSDVAASAGIFAPTLRHHDGTFYLTTTNVSSGGHFVVTADDPAGEWSDPLYVDAPGIDPDLFWDDGTCYFSYFTGDPERGIEQAELDLATGELGEPRTIWRGWADPYAEAPHIYERDGRYYLVAAEGGTHTGHSAVVGRSDTPEGPFEPASGNPLLTHRTMFQHDVHATGHADFVTDSDGNWWLVCLGIRPRGGFPGWQHLGRETFLAPVTWADGWPVVEDSELPAELPADLPGDDPDGSLSSIRHTETDFTDGRGVEWQWRRTPDRDRYAFTDDGLVLSGGPETLSEKGTTGLYRRQTDFDCRVRADLQFDPAPGDEAGIALVMDDEHHYSLGVAGGDRREAQLRLRIGDATEVVARRPVGEHVTLGIDADAERYHFLVDGEELADARAKYLATEVAGGFTGVMVGPYATGNGEPADSPACFERFVYEPIEHGE